LGYQQFALFVGLSVWERLFLPFMPQAIHTIESTTAPATINNQSVNQIKGFCHKFGADPYSQSLGRADP
jgi:hypothetical protein